MGEAARLSGKIKWFNRSKGFGFIVPDDGTSDVFLPLAVLERSGFGEAPDGASVVVRVGAGAEGPRRDAGAGARRLDRAAAPAARAAAAAASVRATMAAVAAIDSGGGPAELLDGVVKWYDPARGFGFILPNDGGKDIFVHVTALRRSGLDMLEPGQPVRMMVAQARRGREASSIELI